MKRIALIGNMNNNFFSVARYLRDNGLDAHLFLLKEELSHFHPSCDSYSDDYKEFVTNTDISKYPSNFWHFSSARIRDLFGRFDFILGCGISPAYLSKANIRMDIFVPYGDDFYRLPFYKKPTRGIKKNIKKYWMTYHQRRGIKQARYLWKDHTNPANEKIVSKLYPFESRIKMNFPFVYLPEYDFNHNNIEYSSENFEKILSKRHKYDFVVFHHCRHSWKSVPIHDFAYKANDKIVIAAQQLIEHNRNCRPLFVFIEYGEDVHFTKEMIHEFGLDEYFLWLPMMPRKEIMYCLQLADLGIGELGHSWFSYGAAFEFLCAGVPLIHRRDDHLYKEKNLYPMINAKSEKDLIEILSKFKSAPERFKEIGNAGKKWVSEWGIKRPLEKLLQLIHES